MIASAMGSWDGMGCLAMASGGGFMDSLPDPMKLQLPVVTVVIVLLVLLFLSLKHLLFKPLTKVMDEREAVIRAGSATKMRAASQIEARQADYAAHLKDLRSQAFEHSKALGAAVTEEKRRILDIARQTATAQRAKALEDLLAEQKTAEADLRTQVDALSESMVQHILKQA